MEKKQRFYIPIVGVVLFVGTNVAFAQSGEPYKKLIDNLNLKHKKYTENKAKYTKSRHYKATVAGHKLKRAYTLARAFQDALYYDGIYAQARADYLATKNNTLAAWSIYFPQLTANGVAFSNTSLNTSASFAVNVQQMIFNWSAIRQISRAKAEVREAVLRLSYAEQDLMSRTALAYFNVVKYQALLRVNKSQQTAILKQLRAMQERAQYGHATVTDIERVRGTLDLYRSQVLGIQMELRNAFGVLTEITGRVVHKLPMFSRQFKLLKPNPSSIVSWQRRVKEKNLNLKAAEEGVLVAKAEIGVQSGKYIPSVSFQGAYYPEKVAGIDKHFTYGVNVSFSGLDGGNTIAEVGVADAEYQKALSNRDMAYRDAARQLSDSYSGMTIGVAQLRSARMSVSSNYRALKFTRDGYVAGTQTILDVLDQQGKLFDAKRSYVNDQVNYLISMIGLEWASGSLSPTVLTHLQAWFR